MAEVIGIVGPSGSGKSTSIVTLNPKSTAIIAVDSKGLPFEGWKKQYTELKGSDFSKGNYVVSESSETICKVLKRINDERPDITDVIIDDYQYIMGNEFMYKHAEKGYDKFSSIGYNGWIPIKTAKALSRQDLNVFFLMHDESTADKDYNPVRKIKTIGKMVDEKYTLEGMFRVLLFTKVIHDSKTKKSDYVFVTQSDSITTAKSPMNMFSQHEIPNSLDYVSTRIREYDLGIKEGKPMEPINLLGKTLGT